MKSKIVFILVLFSLFLNIFHDFLIEEQVPSNASVSVIVNVDKSQNLQNTLCDLHKLFHFTAILPLFETFELSSQVSTKLAFRKKISSQNILETSFKPPRI